MHSNSFINIKIVSESFSERISSSNLSIITKGCETVILLINNEDLIKKEYEILTDLNL